MAGSFGDALENKLLDHLLKTTPFSVPTNIYIELYTVAPSDAGGGTPAAGGSYARKVCNAWDGAAGGATANTGAITFVQATGDWGEIVAFALFDAITGGNFLAWADLTVNKSILNGDTAEFAAGELDITLT